MARFVKQLWTDEEGFLLAAELIFIATLLVIGLVAGWTKLRNAAVEEMNDVGLAIGSIQQSFSYAGATFTGGGSFAIVDGSSFVDQQDATDAADGLDLPGPGDGMAVANVNPLPES